MAPKTPANFGRCMAFVDVSPEEQPGKRYMSLYPAWVPSTDLLEEAPLEEGVPPPPSSAFGGHVYAQSALVACQAMQGKQISGETEERREMPGLHTIQGVFSVAGRCDRPFVYDVAVLSSGRTFRTCFVTARQPLDECKLDANGNFEQQAASLPLGGISFSCICTFKSPEPSHVSSQDEPPQKRFAALVKSRAPSAWPPCPPVDIDAIVEAFPHVGGGSFPMLEMRKVDLSGFNAGKPAHERRELVLYRLLAPLDSDRANDHVAVHAYEADRNGLLMAGNHLGLGYQFGKAASLSYGFYVHVDAEQAVMRFGQPEEDVWWVHEAEFPRAGHGRAALLTRIWSPEGVHVATMYQDGILRPANAVRL